MDCPTFSQQKIRPINYIAGSNCTEQEEQIALKRWEASGFSHIKIMFSLIAQPTEFIAKIKSAIYYIVKFHVIHSSLEQLTTSDQDFLMAELQSIASQLE